VERADNFALPEAARDWQQLLVAGDFAQHPRFIEVDVAQPSQPLALHAQASCPTEHAQVIRGIEPKKTTNTSAYANTLDRKMARKWVCNRPNMKSPEE
jgi:hypothetical protein